MDLLMFLVLSLCITSCKIDARNNILLDSLMKNQHQLENDFDCIDIYKQPSLQNPVLKNHKIQVYPTFANNITQSKSSYDKIVDGCLVGEVPIYNRRKIQQNITNSSSRLETDDFPQYSKSSSGYYTVTLDTTRNMIFHGTSAGISAYNLSLQAKQYSMSSIWLESGPPMELNSIKVGLGVHPSLYGDSQLRLTGHWTADSYKKTGCYNIICPGFVQVNHNKDYAIGSVSHPTSSIGSTTKYIGYIKIKQDQITGHWWLIIQTTKSIYVGYWPKELFTHLTKGASLIRFGGQTYTPPNEDSPPMGSGRLPREKFRNSGFMGLLKIIDFKYNEIDIKPKDMKRYINTNSDCYDLWYRGYEGYQYRQAFLYGGPGGQNCDI